MSWDIKLLLNIMTTIRIYYTCNIEVFNRYNIYHITHCKENTYSHMMCACTAFPHILCCLSGPQIAPLPFCFKSKCFQKPLHHASFSLQNVYTVSPPHLPPPPLRFGAVTGPRKAVAKLPFVVECTSQAHHLQTD